MPIIRRLVKLVGSGIGAARESYLEHQEGKASAASSSGPANSPGASRTMEDEPPQYLETDEAHAQELIKSGKAVPVNQDDSSDSDNELEEAWLLDDANEDINPPAYSESEASENDANADTKDLAAQVLHLAPPAQTAKARLPLPVVLPQRRPRAKGRGFVRAYSPVLDDCALNQDTFLRFLKNFHRASQASKGLGVVFLAATVVGFVPEMVAQIVSTVVQFGAGTAIELQRRYRANTFLDEMNEKLFRPRGLFAMVVAYKPDAKKAIEVGEFDPDASVARYGDGSQNWKQKIRATSGKNHGELNIGEVAPLIYPAIEEAREGKTEEQRSNWKKFEKFMSEYGDKRAQAQYQHQNPGSALSGPQPQFRSRYADPNHPANSGSIISLITGGHVNPFEGKDRRRQERRERRAARLGRPVKDRSQGGIIRRALQENVAYLLIVNMPSEEELASARAKLAAEQH